jgi:hypothetical protein
MTKPEKNLQTEPLVSPRSFCWNEKCADYGRVGAGNLRKFGFTRKGRQRWQCTTCEGTFSETHGTVFHGKKHDEQTILECLAMVADRNSLPGDPSHQRGQGRNRYRLADAGRQAQPSA